MLQMRHRARMGQVSEDMLRLITPLQEGMAGQPWLLESLDALLNTRCPLLDGLKNAKPLYHSNPTQSLFSIQKLWQVK
jgi:hypothetical protein